jgi:hypothetical protein
MLASRIPWGVAALAVFLFSCGAIASAQEHRFEVSINTGHANPPFVFQGPEPFRAPPPSVVRQRPERQFHVRPAPTPFFGPSYDVSETLRRQATTVSILQSVDLVGRGRVRPWLAGGIGYIHAVDRQQMISVSGDESLRGYLGETPLGALNALWSVGIGVGF